MMVQRGIEAAMRATAAMQRQGTVIELDASLARDAGRLGVELKMPMADGIVYATARASTASSGRRTRTFRTCRTSDTGRRSGKCRARSG